MTGRDEEAERGSNKIAWASDHQRDPKKASTFPPLNTLRTSPQSPLSPFLGREDPFFSKMASIMAIPMLPFPSPIFCAAAFRLCNCSLLVAEAAPPLSAGVAATSCPSIAEGGRANVAEVEVEVVGAAETPAGDSGVVMIGIPGVRVGEPDEEPASMAESVLLIEGWGP